MDTDNMPMENHDARGSIRNRIDGINKKFADSKEVLREWVNQQNRAMDLEEADIRNKDEAIDVDPIENVSSIMVDSVRDAKFNALMSQADELMSKLEAETP